MAVQDPREISRQKGLGVNYSGNSTSNGEKKTTTKDKKSKTNKNTKSLRYPYAMLTDSTDYLKIDIAEYKAPGATIEGLSKIVPTTNEKGEVTKTTVTATSEKDFTAGLKSIAAKTGTSINKGQLKKPLHTIYLPIPQQLSDTSSVNWDNSTLNPIEAFGVAAAGSVMKAGDAANAIANATEAVKLLTEKVGLVAGNDQMRQAITAALAGTAVGALGGNVSGSQLVSRATGQVFNPNLELLFQGVNLRSFPFSFDIFPRNQKEAEVVKEIIRTLKISMAAKKNSTNDAQSGIFISAPRVFQLTYMKGRNKHPFLNKFLPMALTSMNLSYTASNTYSTFYDGTPTHMKLDLVFKELNPVYFEDYIELQISGDQSVGY